MGFFNAMKIGASGLAAQRLRMNILSTNLANANTTRTPEGEPYRRKDVVFSAIPTGNEFEDFLDDSYGTQLQEVRVIDVHKDQRDPRRVHDPSHPDADENGYVKLPNIQIMTEMVNMITATRSFEANTTAMNSAKQMALRALEIGR